MTKKPKKAKRKVAKKQIRRQRPTLADKVQAMRGFLKTEVGGND
jgi:hypothetical protein